MKDDNLKEKNINKLNLIKQLKKENDELEIKYYHELEIDYHELEIKHFHELEIDYDKYDNDNSLENKDNKLRFY